MKKPIQKPIRKIKPDSVELRRWCVEMAIRWPTSGFYQSGGIGGGAAGYPHPPHSPGVYDQDVLGRAKKLLEWVTE